MENNNECIRYTIKATNIEGRHFFCWAALKSTPHKYAIITTIIVVVVSSIDVQQLRQRGSADGVGRRTRSAYSIADQDTDSHRTQN